MKIIPIIGILLISGIIFVFLRPEFSSPNSFTPSITSSPVPSHLSLPINKFNQRITKKKFGTFVTPQNSPVTPEIFTGYHTGVDVEYEDISSEVSVMAISDGTVIYSGYVKGYGGFVAQKTLINGQNYIVTYGHLAPNSLVKNNLTIKKGDKIGILGQGYSSETDNERKHLHFSVIKGQTLNLRGYVSRQSDLSNWIDPLTLFP